MLTLHVVFLRSRNNVLKFTADISNSFILLLLFIIIILFYLLFIIYLLFYEHIFLTN